MEKKLIIQREVHQLEIEKFTEFCKKTETKYKIKPIKIRQILSKQGNVWK